MTKEKFLKLLTEEVKTYKQCLETDSGDWIVKGFIDVSQNVYTITNDTKVVSKIIELLLIPRLTAFAHTHGLELELPSKQNYYPDLTFKDNEGHLFAVDFKSSYYADNYINGLTLGSYWGYFRNRNVVTNMDHPYNSYASHTVLGILYKQNTTDTYEYSIHKTDELEAIHSVIRQFIFFVQPKWKIANDTTGSGNTRNIGSITDITKLQNGQGPFANLGEEVFDHYWMNYYNKADAIAAGIGTPHYYNMSTYIEYLKQEEKLSQKFKQ